MSDGLAIEVRGLAKTFGAARVVDGVDLDLRWGRVHAILGGNGSGKSTLLKMLAGVYDADPGGTIAPAGGGERAGERFGPADAAAAGLRFVHQDLGLVEGLTIAENFGLDAGFPRRRGPWIDWRRLRRATARSLAALDVDLDPRTPIAELRPSDRTLFAIARALRDADEGTRLVLVLDEPTASLPQPDVARLHAALRDCRRLGHAVVYVSHRLAEVLDLADDITVLRDGRVVGRGPVAEFSERRIVELMSDPAVESSGAATRTMRGERAVARPGQPVLALRAFAAGPLRDVDLDLEAGEVVGVAGLLGSGRSSLLRAVFGDLRHGGSVAIDGRPVELASTRAAIRAGIALVPEDRHRDAAFLDRPVWENMSAAVVGRYVRRGRVDRRAERRDALALLEAFRVRAASPDVPLATLSGGNQQKAIVARWLRTGPRVLLLDEPSQGVDAVARAEIHGLIRAQVEEGATALVVSGDFEELEALCDRVVVLRGGTAVAELRGAELTAARLTALTQVDDQIERAA